MMLKLKSKWLPQYPMDYDFRLMLPEELSNHLTQNRTFPQIPQSW